MTEEEIPEDQFSSDEDFDEDDLSETSTDVDAQLAEEEVFDAEFLKCYAALKKKDEKIYDSNVKFFNNDDPSSSNNVATTRDVKINKSKASKMTLIDHQLALARGDIEELSPDDKLNKAPKSYYEKELDEIKKSIARQGDNIDSDSEDDLLVVKGSNASNGPTHLKIDDGKLDKVEDSNLKELWSNPDKLSDEDKYLRDYIMNKRYLPNTTPTESKPNLFFSKNIDDLSDAEDEVVEVKKVYEVDPHSEIARVPRGSTKTIRDLVEKQRKKEKRLKKVEKKKKKKLMLKGADYEDIIDDLPIKFLYKETKPQDCGLTAEELLMATDDEAEMEPVAPTGPSSVKRKKKHKRGLNHKKFAKTGVAPDRLLAYGLSKTKLKKSKLL